jgi:hypothetical protein
MNTCLQNVCMNTEMLGITCNCSNFNAIYIALKYSGSIILNRIILSGFR